MRRFLIAHCLLLSLVRAQAPAPDPADALLKRLVVTKWVNEPKSPLPRGVAHKVFFSKALNREVGYLVYLPPDYETAGRRYPVIYNLHGAGGNELHGMEEARILDEGIAAGTLPPMIMAMPNGGTATLYQ